MSSQVKKEAVSGLVIMKAKVHGSIGTWSQTCVVRFGQLPEGHNTYEATCLWPIVLTNRTRHMLVLYASRILPKTVKFLTYPCILFDPFDHKAVNPVLVNALLSNSNARSVNDCKCTYSMCAPCDWQEKQAAAVWKRVRRVVRMVYDSAHAWCFREPVNEVSMQPPTSSYA